MFCGSTKVSSGALWDPSSLPLSHNCELGGLVTEVSVDAWRFAWCMCARTRMCTPEVNLGGYLSLFLYFGIGSHRFYLELTRSARVAVQEQESTCLLPSSMITGISSAHHAPIFRRGF